jgi:hypothetical protein
VSFEPILLAPQKEEQELYPYRRVWRTAIIEIGILLFVTVGTVLAVRFAALPISEGQGQTIGLAYALLPLGLWVVFSYLGERRAPEPRPRLFTVAILGALVANAVGLPLVNRLLNVNEWLATAPGSSRLIGYMLTVGISQEFLKYAVVRYSVWPGAFRIRSDGVAYMLAAAIGYATVVNVDFVLNNSANPSVYALRIAEFTLTHLATSTIMGYFLAELKLTRGTSIFWMPGGLLLAALLASLSIVLRGGLVVGGIGPSSTGNTAFQGLGAAVFLVIFLFASIYFLINNADERAQLRGRLDFQR